MLRFEFKMRTDLRLLKYEEKHCLPNVERGVIRGSGALMATDSPAIVSASKLGLQYAVSYELSAQWAVRNVKGVFDIMCFHSALWPEPTCVLECDFNASYGREAQDYWDLVPSTIYLPTLSCVQNPKMK
jgi:hypothetical protein